MKFIVTFKTPDAVDDAINAVVPKNRGDEVEQDRLDAVADECKALANRFCRYGEYVIIEFDTEAGTATVLEV